MGELNVQPPAAANDSLFSLGLRCMLRLWTVRRFLLKAALLGGALGLIIALLLPKQYASTTRLMPPDRQSPSGAGALAAMLGDRAAGVGADALGLRTPGAVFVQVLGSRTVEDHLIDRFALRNIYGVSLYKDARQRLTANTEIYEDRKSGVISVTVVAKSPPLAAALAKGYVDELNRLMRQVDNSAAHRERVFIEQRLQSVRQELDRDLGALGEFSSRNTTIDLSEQGKSMVTAAATLRGQAIAAESELAGLRQIYGPDNSRVRASAAKADELRRQFARVSVGAGSDSDGDGFPSIRKLPLLAVKYSDLYRNVKVEEAVFETLTKQYEIAKIQEAKDTPSLNVLDEADVPEWKLRPQRGRFTVLGTLLAAALASLYILAGDWWNAAGDDSGLKLFARTVCAGVAEDFARIPGLRTAAPRFARWSVATPVAAERVQLRSEP
jgi:uncharacterized protein involved in exopolysaccharide biosynthesis